MRRWNRWIVSLMLLAAIALAVTLGRLAESAMSLGPLPEHGRAVRASAACPPEENSDFVIVSGSASVWSWYQQRMAYMAEPILACGPSTNDEAYRFTWVHAFAALDPLSVRVVRRGTRLHLVGLRYKWRSGPSLAVASTVDRMLSEQEWVDLQAAVSQGFWNLPGHSKNVGFDGATWMTEGRIGSRYHLVTRWEPRLTEERSVALVLLRLAGLTLPE